MVWFRQFIKSLLKKNIFQVKMIVQDLIVFLGFFLVIEYVCRVGQYGWSRNFGILGVRFGRVDVYFWFTWVSGGGCVVALFQVFAGSVVFRYRETGRRQKWNIIVQEVLFRRVGERIFFTFFRLIRTFRLNSIIGRGCVSIF